MFKLTFLQLLVTLFSQTLPRNIVQLRCINWQSPGLNRFVYVKNIMIFQIKFSSLSAPTKIEELTAGSDEKTQRSPAGNRTQGLANSSRTLWPLSYEATTGTFEKRIWLGMIPTRASLRLWYSFSYESNTKEDAKRFEIVCGCQVF